MNWIYHYWIKCTKRWNLPPEKLQQLQKIIKEADGYVPITPEYNHSVSSALKNTLDYFLEEYFFKPSAIVSYSVGSFGGVTAGNHLRQILAEMGTLAISSQFPISKVHEVFDDEGKLLDENYERRFSRFLKSLNGMFLHLQNKENLERLTDYTKSSVFGITL